MDIIEIIDKKKNAIELSKQEINFFITEYTQGNITDYQAAALIMAIYINGMTDKEITDLTLSMANSGKILDLSSIGGTIVDKHSTGGVGDKVSIILLPLVSSLGVKVAKMSGRALGFTGGTVDKLESIPGYRTNLSDEEFINNVKQIGISMISQTANLAPADKKIYALRDSISCVDSIPLISSSIMSKKIASGADKIVLEVAYGRGAFMKCKEDAQILAEQMVRIGKLANKQTEYILTDMNEPLGYAIGNSLEVIEAIQFLKGISMSKDLMHVVLEIGSHMIKLAGLCDDLEKNKQNMLANINNGKAYQKFLQMVKKQGGDITYLEDTNKFEKPRYIQNIISDKSGTVKEIQADVIAKYVCSLGAGRMKKEDSIDKSVGIVLHKKVNDIVHKGDILATIYSNDVVIANYDELGIIVEKKW